MEPRRSARLQNETTVNLDEIVRVVAHMIEMKGLLKTCITHHKRSVRFNPEVQVCYFGSPEITEEDKRPPVFCKCDDEAESDNIPRVACDSCNRWHTVRCLNISAKQSVAPGTKHAWYNQLYCSIL
jgi:hypothetical protein